MVKFVTHKKYVDEKTGPCESWCTNDSIFGSGCGDIKNKLCFSKKTTSKSVNNNIEDEDEKIMIKKLHPVLTYRMENNRIGCLNRDKNSCLNMLNIIETWKLKKEYPTYLKRSISIDNPL